MFPVVTLDSMPEDGLRHIMARLSLLDIYRLRHVCRALGVVASPVVQERVYRNLIGNGDFPSFIEFVEELRKLPNGKKIGFASWIGKLLKTAGVPCSSVAASVVGKHFLSERGGSSKHAASMYRKMGATIGDVRCALYGIGYTNPQDYDPDELYYKLRDEVDVESIVKFVRVFDFPEAVVEDLYLSIKEIDLVDRWRCLWKHLNSPKPKSKQRRSKVSPDDFVSKHWRRVVSTARTEHRTQQCLTDRLKEFLDIVDEGDSWNPSDSLDAKLFAPNNGLSATQNGNLLGDYCPNVNRLYCYLEPEPGCEITIDAPAGSASLPVATPAQSTELFAALLPERSGETLAIFLSYGYWPKRIDPNHPDFRNLVQFNERSVVDELCVGLEGDTISDQHVEEHMQRFRRFIEANEIAIHSAVWLKELNSEVTRQRQRYAEDLDAGSHLVLEVFKTALEETLAA